AIVLFILIYQTDEFLPDKLFNFDLSAGGSISRRYYLFIGGLKSALHNYGTGFGVGGSHYYYTHVFASSDLFADTDPHNFFIELLINSGIVVAIGYVVLNILIVVKIVQQGADKLIIVQFLLYNVLLLSSSSSLFLWPHYIFYFTYVFHSQNKEER